VQWQVPTVAEQHIERKLPLNNRTRYHKPAPSATETQGYVHNVCILYMWL
jgi:hypothetical protein